MKRKRSYSTDTQHAAFRALEAAQPSHDVQDPPSWTPVELATLVSGGASKRSIYRWRRKDMSEAAVQERLGHRGRRPLLSEDHEHLLVGHVIHLRLGLKVVSRQDLLDFASAYLDAKLHPPFLSKLLKRHDISLQRTRGRLSRTTNVEVVEGAIKVISHLRELSLPPHRILVMDETGLWSNVVSKMTYHFKGWYGEILF
jgi:hypothetical protein